MDIVVVRRSLYYRPVLIDGSLGTPGKVLLRYSNAFPFAVRLLFPAKTVEINRQMLADGIDHEASDNDTTVKHLQSSQVEITRHDGTLKVRMSRNALIDALAETRQLVEIGREFDVFDVDLWLSAEGVA